MRGFVTAERLRRFMRAFGGSASEEGICYLAGGATAVLFGWRESTIDVDLRLVPEQDALLRVLPDLKEALEINVEFASPGDFIPLPPQWEERSPFVACEGLLTFRHLDPYAQALAKIERSHAKDLEDIAAMLGTGLVERSLLLERFAEIEPELYRFPAVDPRTFRAAVERVAS